MNKKEIIKNIVIIIVLLTVVFLSQQPYFNEIGKKFYFQAEARVKVYWNSIYPKVRGEVEQKSAVIKQEIDQQKNNIMQNTWEKIKNYFAEKFSKISGTEVK